MADSRTVRFKRILVPLDGEAATAAAVAPVMAALVDDGAELILLHVFGPGTVPAFWDQSVHAERAFAEEFRARSGLGEQARIEVRTGVPSDHILTVAEQEAADLIVLPWSQSLDAGRAETVRATVTSSSVPVLLVPIAAGA